MPRLLALALLAALIALQAKLWFGAGGHGEVEALKTAVARQEAENAALRQRNAALAAEVEDLKSGRSAIEERARSELGMIRPGETYYRIIDEPAAGAPPR
ncbi:MAG: cell division protein FtsB [Lysobacteraceae bacterium]